MQQSSNSIGSLAAALAKAQIELVNPEKSMVATIRADGTAAASRFSAMRRCQAASILCAKPWANMRSLLCRRPRSITRQEWLISLPRSAIRAANG